MLRWSYIFLSWHRDDAIAGDVLSDELDVGDRIHADNARLKADANCAFFSLSTESKLKVRSIALTITLVLS